jgi:hypothetical protein
VHDRATPLASRFHRIDHVGDTLGLDARKCLLSPV